MTNEEEEFSESVGSESGDEFLAQQAGKLVRFFTHSEENRFALFVECGLNRTIEAVPTLNHEAIR